LSDWIVELIQNTGYLGVAFLMFLETVFPPIPSEVIMALAGLSASKGEMTLWGAILSGTAGAMLGNYFWYLVARVIGIDRFRPLIERHGRWLTMDWAEIERGERLFARYGAAYVFFGRMLPTIRSLISIPAGLLKLRLSTFVIWSTLGTAGWTTILAVAGYQLGQNFGEVETYVGPVSTAIIVLIVLGYVWRLITWRPARRPESDT
jgi:membrane protein DedA with SNARE-associated domain